MNSNSHAGEKGPRRSGQRTLDLPAALVEELKSEANRLGRSLSSVVQMAWRISNGQAPDPPEPPPQPWEPVAAELTRRLSNPSKRRTASRAWLHFERWCAERGHASLPARDETLAAYAAERLAGGAPPKEVLRAAAAISLVHRVRGGRAPRLRPSARKAVERILAGEAMPRRHASAG
ncbi:MAG TPA: hypothetical protein VFA20_28410 [Myxococcaceae bacterium]|nr:hypothetical protein [Myxococcaceae bacterium]